ncbi:MAG: LOG family protein, partial [Phycisphaerae bacterium]|nr:LOG family protein [Phycisphaerae bacterium]
MATGNITTISVFGSNDPAAGSEAYAIARAAGRTLAELGYTVANGGYGGTMEASAHGAKEAGGDTVGVTCEIWKTAANRYIDRTIQTASHHERLETLVELGGGGYVVLPGATGTLLELATVWELACKKLARPRPIVCVGEFWQPLVKMMS